MTESNLPQSHGGNAEVADPLLALPIFVDYLKEYEAEQIEILPPAGQQLATRLARRGKAHLLWGTVGDIQKELDLIKEVNAEELASAMVRLEIQQIWDADATVDCSGLDADQLKMAPPDNIFLLRYSADSEDEFWTDIEGRFAGVHEAAPRVWDWRALAQSPIPPEPTRLDHHEAAAVSSLNERLADLQGYRPGFFEKLFGAHKTRIAVLEADVETARSLIDFAKLTDHAENEIARKRHAEEVQGIHATRRFASLVLSRDTDTWLRMLRALPVVRPFPPLACRQMVEVLGIGPDTMRVSIETYGECALPDRVQFMGKRGRMLDKPFPVKRGNEILQDFVCGVGIRVARDLFAFLPLHAIWVDVLTRRIDSSTGHLRPVPVLSTRFDRETLEGLRLEMVDASDAMSHFEHRMDFKVTTGLKPIQPLGT